jgi:hypothetical protein
MSVDCFLLMSRFNPAFQCKCKLKYVFWGAFEIMSIDFENSFNGFDVFPEKLNNQLVNLPPVF